MILDDPQICVPEIVVAGGGMEVAARCPGRVQRVDVVDESYKGG